MIGQNVLLYDSECNLCIRFKKALELVDTKNLISYKSIHDPVVYIDYPNLKKGDCEEIIHLVGEDGHIYRGSEVIEFLVTKFPAVAKFSWLLESDSAKSAMDAFYNRLNKMRLMKKKKCFTCGSSKIKRG